MYAHGLLALRLPTPQMETVHSLFLIKATVGQREREWLYNRKLRPTLPQPGRDVALTARYAS